MLSYGLDKFTNAHFEPLSNEQEAPLGGYAKYLRDSLLDMLESKSASPNPLTKAATHGEVENRPHLRASRLTQYIQ